MNYVIGGGVAGLLWAFYHEDFKVIAEKPGGAMASTFTIGPRYLHAAGHTLDFIKDVGLTAGEEAVVNAGVAGNSGLRGDYMIKTRGTKDCGEERLGATYEAMQSRHVVLRAPTLKQVSARLVELLSGQGRVIRGKVTGVEGHRRLVNVGDGWKLEYDKLVSTIPLPWFVKLMWSSQSIAWGGEYLALPVLFNHHFITGRWPWPGADYVYVPDPALPFSRITRLDEHNGTWACVEYPGLDGSRGERGFDSSDLRLKELVDVGPCVSSAWFPLGRVISRQIPDATRGALRESGVKMFGRFATWQDWVLTHHLIQMARSNRWEDLA